MADVPKDLLQQIKEFEDIFTVGTEKLKEIVAHFVKELEKGTLNFLPIAQSSKTLTLRRSTDA
jgi:hexokinase